MLVSVKLTMEPRTLCMANILPTELSPSLEKVHFGVGLVFGERLKTDLMDAAFLSPWVSE